MSYEGPTAGNLTGSLLVAHPNLHDPNFRRTILFLSHHSAEEGAIGLVLNRPLRKTLGDVADGDVADPARRAPLFYGGPVSLDQVTIASLQWHENPTAVAFHSHNGDPEEFQIDPRWQPGLRAFLGYAGWTHGQLESEIAQKAWILVQPTREIIEMTDPITAWHEIMQQTSPLLRLLAEAPDHPERN